ncbi:alpha/beta fold hydrolase [Arthrobacter sp. AD-310]
MRSGTGGYTRAAGVLAVHWHGRDDAAAGPLVLLHGLTDSGRCWAEAVSSWAGEYRVAALDALGHGASPRFTPGQLSRGPMEAMLETTLTAVQEISSQGLGKPILVGHSMGAGIAAALAVRAPALVAGLVLEDPAWFATGDWDQDAAAHWNVVAARNFRADLTGELAKGRQEHPHWPESEMYEWARAKTLCDDAFLATGLAALPVPYADVAAALDVPALVVCGTRDVFVDEAKRAVLTAIGNPRLEVRVVDGAGHCVRRDKSAAYHAIVDPWIRTVLALDRDRQPR